MAEASPRSMASRILRETPAVAVIVAASYLFRLPPLLNARSTNSDAAIVGLQAMHILHGERSAFLWGSGYQTSADAWVAAVAFKVFGSTALVLMLSALTLHVAATFFVYGSLRRRFDALPSVLLVLPLVFSPSSVHSYALYPPRQLSLTLALAAFWAVHGARVRFDAQEGLGPLSVATLERKGLLWLFFGGVLGTLAVAADPYTLLLVPIGGLLAALVARDDLRSWIRRFVTWAVGAGLGIIPFLVLHRMKGSTDGQLGLTADGIGRRFDLLVGECLPWALSYKVYFARHVMDYQPWDAPVWFRVLGVTGALLLVAAVFYAFIAVFVRSMPWRVRAVGFAAACTFPLALVAFLLSVMVMDHFSMRYLVVLTLMTPFVVSPAAYALGPKRFALAFAPHVAASAVAGWIGYGPFVHGFRPVRETAELRDDYAAIGMLHGRGIKYAMADYWASYRLTFLSQESLVVVPKNPAEDRYWNYRRAFEAEHVWAYIFDPNRSREDLAEAEDEITKASASVEKVKVGELTILVATRRP
jgi:hypothetical protein